jgi:hypothetical protein
MVHQLLHLSEIIVENKGTKFLVIRQKKSYKGKLMMADEVWDEKQSLHCCGCDSGD